MVANPICVEKNEESCTTSCVQGFGGYVFSYIHHSVRREFLHEHCDTLRQVI